MPKLTISLIQTALIYLLVQLDGFVDFIMTVSVYISIHHLDFCVSRKKPLSPSVFKYTVRMDGHSEPFIINASRIR